MVWKAGGSVVVWRDLGNLVSTDIPTMAKEKKTIIKVLKDIMEEMSNLSAETGNFS